MPAVPGSATPEQGRTAQQEIPFRIDPDALANRITRLPVPPGRYSGLKLAADGKLLFFEATSPDPFSGKKKLRRLDMKSGTIEDVLPEYRQLFSVADGLKMLYSLDRKWGIISAMESHRPGAGLLDLSRLEMTLTVRLSGARFSGKPGGNTGTISMIKTCTASTGRRSGKDTNPIFPTSASGPT